MDPNFKDRIRLINGDLIEQYLGISDSDRTELSENVNIIIHAAADVRFDKSLLQLIDINLRGTLRLLQMAEKFKQLEIFMYISTAFSQMNEKITRDQFYSPPIDPYVMLNLAENIKDDLERTKFEVMTECITKPWPNTYSYSKALSEDLVRSFADKFQIAVLRPPISKSNCFINIL